MIRIIENVQVYSNLASTWSCWD